MPLSALLNSEMVYAFNFTPLDWHALRSRVKELHHPCCDAGVVLKRSYLGTQFFAHARKGVCVTGPETMQHLQAKDVIAKAAIEAGWKAETEVQGKTPAGEAWIADVLVTRGNVKLAFEVQLTQQPIEVTQARQTRYEVSGIRGLWFMRRGTRKDLPRPSKMLPIFSLESTPEGFNVAIDWTYSFSRPEHWVPLDRFVTGALSKRLIWRPFEGKTVPVIRRVYRRQCLTCHKWNALPCECSVNNQFSFNPDPVFQHSQDLMEALYPTTDRQRYVIAEMKTGGELLWMTCRHCGASLMDWTKAPFHKKSVQLPTIQVMLTAGMLDAMENPYATNFWAFNHEPAQQP